MSGKRVRRVANPDVRESGYTDCLRQFAGVGRSLASLLSPLVTEAHELTPVHVVRALDSWRY
eukprot:5317766-Pyramimonas_sp.AAC.1